LSFDQWIAFIGVAIALVTMLVGGVIAMLKVSFKLGGLSERVAKLERDIEKADEDRAVAQVHLSDLAVMTSVVKGMKDDLGNFMTETRGWRDRMDGDIRNVLLAKGMPQGAPPHSQTEPGLRRLCGGARLAD
jgi:hypothetical protein